MTGADYLVCAGSVATPVALAIISLAGDSSLSWATSPLHWPALHVFPVVALVGLMTPLLRRSPVLGTERSNMSTATCQEQPDVVVGA
jgi:hypothetical protein